MKGREREVAMREKRLYEASLIGSVDTLNELMKEDVLTLARVCVTCFDETPLHIAAMLGHTDFAAALVSLKPGLVTELNSHGFSPLHLASVNGYVEIVRNLLAVNTDVCLVRDEDGRTPLHVAVMKGRIDVIIELVHARPEAIGYILDRGETLLHSCVKHNRLRSLKVLVELGRVDDFLNVKDHDGNTILHMATSFKQMETTKYLLSRNGVEVNAVNGNGFTALDIIEHMPRDLKGMEIRESLQNARALRARNIPASARTGTSQVQTSSGILLEMVNCEAVAPPPPPPSDVPHTVKVSRPPSQVKGMKKHVKKMNEDWLKKKRDALMVTATVIAAMAYQAGLNPPGGVWQQDVKDPKNDEKILFFAGTSILADTSPDTSVVFWVLNTVSFVTSLSTVLLVVSGLPLKRRVIMWILMAAMWVTITFMALTYLWSMEAIATGHDTNAITTVSVFSVHIWLALIGIVFLVHTFRFLMWCVRNKVRKNRKKRLSGYVTEDHGQGKGSV